MRHIAVCVYPSGSNIKLFKSVINKLNLKIFLSGEEDLCLVSFLGNLKGNNYLAFADTDEYQPIRTLAERYVVRKYDGMEVTIGDGNDVNEKQGRKVWISPEVVEAGMSMVSNLKQFLWRQDSRTFENPKILSSLMQECEVGEEYLDWDESDIFCDLKDSAFKFLTEGIKHVKNETSTEPINDEEDVESILRAAKCGMYLAPSTIPNSGNGMFTGVNVTLGTDLEKMSYFMMSDINFNVGSIRDYLWSLENDKEIRFVRKLGEIQESLLGGFGSLANYHPGLVNVKGRKGPKFNPLLDRTKDPGAGAITDFDNYVTYADRFIVAGSEFFISYGSQWIESRSQYDTIPIPGTYDFFDTMMSSLLSILSIHGDYEYFKILLFLFRSLLESIKGRGKKNTPNTVEDMSKIITERNAESLKTEKQHSLDLFSKLSKRAESIFQTVNTVEDIVNIIKQGSAASIKEEASYSLEWLKKNGRCLDHIYPRLSDIPSAGRGAFSRRFIKKGEVVITSPLMALQKSHLEEFYSQSNTVVPPPNFESRQVILNYCFSHPKSSLALFPLTHAMLINHASVRKGSNRHPNAKIRWATDHTETQKSLYSSLEFVKENEAAKPFLEFVAIRDIEPDEEVLIDYGETWEDAWDGHVTDWSLRQSLDDQKLSSVSILEMNRNKFDVSHSWSNIHMTICDKVKISSETLEGNAIEFYGYEKDDELLDSEVKVLNETLEGNTIEFQRFGKVNEILDFDYVESPFVPCKIQGTNREKETFDVVYYWNGAHVQFNSIFVETKKYSSEYLILKNIPAKYVHFIEKPGQSDDRRSGSFRHEIVLPDDMFPELWKDLSDDI